jgi:Secretion system C-terminal sorting domain
VFAGGAFDSICGVERGRIASLSMNTTGVPGGEPRAAAGLLQSNHPNPFRGSTTIHFVLPAAAQVTLEIFDPAGRRVATLLRDARRDAGAHEAVFRVPDLPSGVYLCRLKAGGSTETRRIVRLR